MRGGCADMTRQRDNMANSTLISRLRR
jgi:hypothetical protein